MFDVVVSSMAIHNISISQNRAKAIKEIVRVLRPGGKVIIQDFQYVDEYKKELMKLNFESVEISKYNFTMFPPTRVLMAVKP